MIVTGEAEFISAKTGTKNEEDWFLLKFLDEDSDEFFTVFVENTLFNKVKNLKKHQPVLITLTLVPGRKYFKLETLEVIE